MGLKMKISSSGGESVRDSELASALYCVGFSRSEALIMAHLSGAGNASFREIEDATRLQISDVRMALKRLKARKLIDDLDVRGDRNGRSVRVYRLRSPLYGIAVHLEEMQLQQIEELGRSVQRLKELGIASRT